MEILSTPPDGKMEHGGNLTSKWKGMKDFTGGIFSSDGENLPNIVSDPTNLFQS